MPFLKLKDARGKESFLQLPEDRTLVFGRETYCDFQLQLDAEISREHFSVGPGDKQGSFVVVDLGSHNGTFLNGEKLGNDEMELKEGDEIKAGSQKLLFFRSRPEDKSRKPAPPKRPGAPAPEPDCPSAD